MRELVSKKAQSTDAAAARPAATARKLLTYHWTSDARTPAKLHPSPAKSTQVQHKPSFSQTPLI